ncbi:MAG: hypothetical protein ACRD59_04475 [Candidatus Acidiferrales bacterium]
MANQAFKKWKDFLWPIGATVLTLVAVPTAIAQYPDFVNKNRWILPVSVAVFVFCWILPFLLHERSRVIFLWMLSFGFLGRLVAVIAAIAILTISTVGTLKLLEFHKEHLAAALRTEPEGLMVSRYDLIPYKIGDPLKIRMYLGHKGSSTITLTGGTHSRFVDKLPSDYEKRRQLENEIWAEKDRYVIEGDRPLRILPMPIFAELMSEDLLTEDRIKKLQHGSVMYLVSVFKNEDGKVIIESCIHTDPLGNSVAFCTDHNSP